MLLFDFNLNLAVDCLDYLLVLYWCVAWIFHCRTIEIPKGRYISERRYCSCPIQFCLNNIFESNSLFCQLFLGRSWERVLSPWNKSVEVRNSTRPPGSEVLLPGARISPNGVPCMVCSLRQYFIPFPFVQCVSFLRSKEVRPVGLSQCIVSFYLLFTTWHT
ncbi:hypothetical protein F5Y19DRAFT_222988 [Xylariaceae sp. FL1651]|nr:hypothetical protein F5Y19DRAFT_222988 [Xylariaceae sp. FL1651]